MSPDKNQIKPAGIQQFALTLQNQNEKAVT